MESSNCLFVYIADGLAGTQMGGGCTRSATTGAHGRGKIGPPIHHASVSSAASQSRACAASVMQRSSYAQIEFLNTARLRSSLGHGEGRASAGTNRTAPGCARWPQAWTRPTPVASAGSLGSSAWRPKRTSHAKARRPSEHRAHRPSSAHNGELWRRQSLRERIRMRAVSGAVSRAGCESRRRRRRAQSS